MGAQIKEPKNLLLPQGKIITDTKIYKLKPTRVIPLWCYAVTTICATINGLQCAVFALDFMNAHTSLSIAILCATASFICNMLTFMMGGSESLYNITCNYKKLLSKPNVWQAMLANVSTCILFFICGMSSWLNNFAVFGIATNVYTIGATVLLSLCCSVANLILLSSGLLHDEKSTSKPVDTKLGKYVGIIIGMIQASAFSFVLYLSSVSILSQTFPNPSLQTIIFTSQVIMSTFCALSQFDFYKNRTNR